MLYQYMKDLERFVADKDQRMLNPSDMIEWINRARRQIASQAQCIRLITPISGGVAVATVAQQGTGYTAPTVTVSPPDFPNGQAPFPQGAQATATATFSGGNITAVNITYGGFGYFQPTITIADPTGSGAVVTASVSPITETIQGQEVYPFSAVPLINFPGVSSILAVKSVSFIYANYRYSIPIYSFSTYQARIRQYPLQYQYVPTMGAQLGQGINGSLYFYPIPSTAYQFELDSICLPIDLNGDGDPEAIPLPWSDAVAFLAAHYAYLSLQNPNMARMYYELYASVLHVQSAGARPGRRTNPAGSW